MKDDVGLRERNKRDKLEAIEQAARDLFADKGFEATTTRELAERAGIGAGTLFVYFPEKKALLLHLFRKDLGPVIDRAWEELPAKADLVGQVAHLFGAIYAYYAGNEALARVFVKELLFLEGDRFLELAEINVALLGRLCELVVAARGRGQVREDVEPLEAAYCFFALYYMGLVTWLGGGSNRETVGPRLESSLGLLLRGMAPAHDNRGGRS